MSSTDKDALSDAEKSLSVQATVPFSIAVGVNGLSPFLSAFIEDGETTMQNLNG